MISLVDYGLGNIKAFANIFKRLGIPCSLAKTPEDLEGASKLILPGVGAFDHAMQSLHQSGMTEMLNQRVQQDKVPVLGICVGMQMLADSSEEGDLPGLGWIPGHVKKLDVSKLSDSEPLPHMGWNTLKQNQASPLFKDLPESADFYFLHSFYFDAQNPAHVLATAYYGEDFACVAGSENVFGMQCHPEKSHQNGISFLKNFAECDLC